MGTVGGSAMEDQNQWLADDEVGGEDEGKPLSGPYCIECGRRLCRGRDRGRAIYGGALAGRRLQHPGGRNATSSIEVFALALSNKDS